MPRRARPEIMVAEAPPTHVTNLDTQLMNEWRNGNSLLKPTVGHT